MIGSCAAGPGALPDQLGQSYHGVVAPTLPRRTTSINAVHEEQTRSLLEDLGVADAYDDGSLRCAICDEPVRDAGLGVARRRDDEVVFSCARLDCMRALS
jgi:hypothetical protein